MCSLNRHFTLLRFRNDTSDVTPNVKGFASGFQSFPVDELLEPSGLYCTGSR